MMKITLDVYENKKHVTASQLETLIDTTKKYGMHLNQSELQAIALIFDMAFERMNEEGENDSQGTISKNVRTGTGLQCVPGVL